MSRIHAWSGPLVTRKIEYNASRTGQSTPHTRSHPMTCGHSFIAIVAPKPEDVLFCMRCREYQLPVAQG